MSKLVYDFSDGAMDMKDLLGGKGANLAEMTKLGLPVPPGFTVTTDACRVYLATGTVPPDLDAQVTEHLHRLEAAIGRRLGGSPTGDDPLLVSVRSGGKFSMPGMMDTILNVGLCDATLPGLARHFGDERFAWDCYRRLVAMFGTTVLGVDGDLYEDTLTAAKERRGAESDVDLTTGDLRDLTQRFKVITAEHGGREFPQDPREQLDLAIRAVFTSWNGERARLYRRREHIPDDLGTAVTVMTMVFGNLGPTSGTGVAFTRDPATGEPGVYGDYLADAEGEDVVAGIRNTLPLRDLAVIDPSSYGELIHCMKALEDHYRDLCDVEFTIERGRLWMLQTRVGKRTAPAAFRIAVQLLDEGVIGEDEALTRVTGAQLAQLMFPRFGESTGRPVARGIAASPGAAVGVAVFDSATAAARAATGQRVILVRRETNPDDLAGMIAAVGILTSRGGKTSHAAVVARGMGRTCVCGAEELTIDPAARRATTQAGTVIAEGDLISIDGFTGGVYKGAMPVVDSPIVAYLEGRPTAALPTGVQPLVEAVDRLLGIADRRRRLGVHANADTPEDAARARRFGAAGIGLCRTEHMFLGKRRRIVESLILAGSEQDDAARSRALTELLPLQRDDFAGILTVMDGLPVTIRLLDPPLHEFLPDLTELSTRLAIERTDGFADPRDAALLRAVQRLHEQNPMLGLRGVRLGLVIPGLYAMQVRAIAEAACRRVRDGGDPRVNIMIPLVVDVHELELVRAECEAVIGEVMWARGFRFPYRIGTMIELPRAALTAGRIARVAEFFSFGTNDLTQTTWGLSRDDAEAAFLPAYLSRGIVTVSPFESVDEDGVGELVQTAVVRGRAARHDLETGVCGEHGGDPDSIHLFHEYGLDYVSCSPYRVPIARLEAGRAAVMD